MNEKLRNYIMMKEHRERHVDDLRRIQQVVASQLYIAELQLEEVNKRIAEMKDDEHSN